MPLQKNENMKFLFVLLIGLFSFGTKIWEPSFENAKQVAAKEHRLILLNFSGSDWCLPCIRMHKQIFGDAAFTAMADSSLVLVNADFPRLKKHSLPKEVVKQNEALAEKYNPQGKFPFTVLLRADGSVVKSWDGLPTGSAADFAKAVKQLRDANKAN